MEPRRATGDTGHKCSGLQGPQAPAGTSPGSRAGPGASGQAGEELLSRHGPKQLGSDSSEGTALAARTPRLSRRLPVPSSPRCQREVGRVSFRPRDLQNIHQGCRLWGEPWRSDWQVDRGTHLEYTLRRVSISPAVSLGAAPALGSGLQSPEWESGLSQLGQSWTDLDGRLGEN